MLTRGTTHLLALVLVALSPCASADSGNWWLGVGCADSGTFGTVNFTACTSSDCNGGTFYSGGTCSRTSTRFTKLAFTTSANGTLRSSTRYALNTGDVLISQAILNSEETPVFTTRSACPSANATLNWAFVQWDSGQRTLADNYLIGTASYSTTSGIAVTGQYDINGSVFWANARPLPGTCVNGVYSVTSQTPDLNGTVNFTASGGGVYKTTAGHATFFFPQTTVNLASDLGSKTAQGISFDSRLAANTEVAKVTTNAAGDQFTITPYTNPDTGDTTGAAYTDVISVTATNYPQNGMLLGTISRDGGAATRVACIVNRTLDVKVICSGESPAGWAYPYTVAFLVEGTCPTNYVRVPANPAVGVNNDFCMSKYEMKIVGQSNGNQAYNGAFVAESRVTGTPWANINRDQSITECQALGTGYDLITNAQWQAAARDIENAYSAGAYLNWANGRQDNTPSQNNVNEGHADGLPNLGLAASTDGNAYYCTNNDGCTTNASGTFSQKRTHQFSNGEIVWDMGGNLWDWVKDNNGSTQGTDGYTYTESWNSGGKLLWGPLGSYAAAGTYPKTASPYGGLGYAWINSAAGAILRGGGWTNTTQAGVFSSNLLGAPVLAANYTGFRCAYTVAP